MAAVIGFVGPMCSLRLVLSRRCRLLKRLVLGFSPFIGDHRFQMSVTWILVCLEEETTRSIILLHTIVLLLLFYSSQLIVAVHQPAFHSELFIDIRGSLILNQVDCSLITVDNGIVFLLRDLV